MIFHLMGDQPTTCPICGARTDIVSDLSHTKLKLQIHECLNAQCRYIFLEIEDIIRCPICGLNSGIISDFSHTNSKLQINECINYEYKHVFLEVEN